MANLYLILLYIQLFYIRLLLHQLTLKYAPVFEIPADIPVHPL